MVWHRPIPKLLVPTKFRDFVTLGHETQLPIAPHPGAYGVKRTHHTHEGVDLYCAVGTPVHAVEDGLIVNIIPFTGPHADPPSPWWHNTWAVLVEGESGVVVYGELFPRVKHAYEKKVKRGDDLGGVLKVLKEDKGYPMSMLHLELHEHGTTNAWDWIDEKPPSLRDPTPFLLEAK
jgi:hypothetical protein